MIKTDRCIIRQIEKNDKEFYSSLQGDSGVREYLGGIKSSESIEAHFQKLISSQDLTFIVTERPTKQAIGIIYIDTYHNQVDTELSYEFIESSWGKGYAYESISRVMNHIFKNLSLSQIVAETQSKNIPSIKLLEKLGFILQEEIIRHGERQKVFILEKS